ncbi:hypothetical protein [Candidatus Methylomirabilis limnetica]|uniref:hypothetical protein n=1 Tax=Candidatus Methylomirabilis limnetica TaxID=2033718 RepID=UPI003D781122
MARWLAGQGVRSPAQITSQALRAHAQDLQLHQRLEPTTVNRRIAALRQWSRWITRTQYLPLSLPPDLLQSLRLPPLVAPVVPSKQELHRPAKTPHPRHWPAGAITRCSSCASRPGSDSVMWSASNCQISISPTIPPT